MQSQYKKQLKKDIIKANASKILIGYTTLNGEFGFFAELQEVFHPINGIKLTSTNENINYCFHEVEYFLLENKTIARFIKEYTHTACSRRLLETYTISKYKKEFKNKTALKAFLEIEQQLLNI